MVDEHTHEFLALNCARSITSDDAVDSLAELFAMPDVPKRIRSDNRLEFTAKAIQRWLMQMEVGVLYIEPGSPSQNCYAEGFHSRLHDEFLTIEEFGIVA
nr:DDE-type integrase/transposase/recombinase [Posidoniimonas corsicana]